MTANIINYVHIFVSICLTKCIHTLTHIVFKQLFTSHYIIHGNITARGVVVLTERPENNNCLRPSLDTIVFGLT